MMNILIIFIFNDFRLKITKNQSLLSTDFVKAEEIIPVGMATIPSPINKIKNVKILPPTVIG